MSNISSSSKRAVLVAGIAMVVGLSVLGGVFRNTEVFARPPGELPGENVLRVQDGEDTSSSFDDPLDLSQRLAGVFVGLAESVTPGVVQVEVRRPGISFHTSMPDLPEPFRQFFDIPEGLRNPSQPPPEEMAGGTGFLISPDGYVLTNAHVVDQADRIVVNLVDRTSHLAELVGVDPTTDLAVIKIDAGRLPILRWGSSRNLRVGEPVMAVGNPGFSGNQSLDYTVTTGIVSAMGRPLSIIRQSLQGDPDLAGYAIENFIQTDAVINPGNSGGPLVDLQGQVIGVNSAIASSDGHYQGYGFAIPADLAKKVASDLMESGRVRRGWLGVSVTGISAEDAEAYKLPRVGGILVQDVVKDGPADKAGLKAEDVLLAVNDVPVQDSGDLQELVAELGPEAQAELEMYREGRRQIVSVRLGEAPFSSHPRSPLAEATNDSESLLGMTVTDLTPEMASDLGFPRSGGVVVTGVTAWSSAMRKGITPGLKIREVDHTPIRDARGFRKVLAGLEEGQVVTMELESPAGTSRIVNLRAEGM